MRPAMILKRNENSALQGVCQLTTDIVIVVDPVALREREPLWVWNVVIPQLLEVKRALDTLGQVSNPKFVGINR